MRTSFLLAALLAATGCATPYTSNSELVGTRYHKTEIDTYPLIVTSVDGVSTPVRQRIWIEPGTREIEVEDPIHSGLASSVKRFKLDVQPCTRYYLVAVKDTRLSSDYEVRVDYTERLEGGCKG
jgi:hypothetical protein